MAALIPGKAVGDSTGHVQFPLQPSFRATYSASQDNIATDSTVTIVFGAEAYDTNADFASNTFTAPVDGKYILTANVYYQNLDSGCAHITQKLATSNEDYVTSVDPNTMYTADVAFITLNNSHVCDMDAGDTASVTIYLDGGAAQMDINSSSNFSGALVC